MMIAIAVVGAYAALCIAARLWYPHALFPAPHAAVVDESLAEKLVRLPQQDGSTTQALYFEPKSASARTVVVFHGNAATMFDEAPLAEELVRRGFGVLLVEYRGYAIDHGGPHDPRWPPTEETLYEDGEAALAHLARKGIPEERIALWGTSLGTVVAVEMAHRGHGKKLVLFAPLTSMIEIGKRAAPILPVSLLLAHRFDSIGKAPKIAQPTVIVHGREDEVIPFAMGEALAAAIPGARFVPVASAHHNDLLSARAGSPSAAEIMDLVAEHLAL